MSCEEYIANKTLRMVRLNISLDEPPNIVEHIHYVFNQIFLPVVCIFGIVGNILNLAVLTRKQLQNSMDRLEKSSHLGLVALAISDLLFCVCAMPNAFFDANKFMYFSSESRFFLYYNIASTGILNTFHSCSTWLTVVMASARYLAICHPLHARSFIHIKGTKISIITVFISSVLINLPWFWQKEIIKQECSTHCTCYIVSWGSLFSDIFDYTYCVIWAVLGVFIPIILLTFCNICLIRALRQSMNMQKRYRVNRPKQDSGHHITPTLIVIVILFMTLVTPSDIIKFVLFILEKEEVILKRTIKTALQSATYITNFMQACNFAINFVLYCILNVHFRKTITYFICCKWRGKIELKKKGSQTATATLMTEDTDL